jgi:dUTP pyrophosphatase
MIRFDRVSEHAKLPVKGTPGSAAHDLYSAEEVTIPPRSRKLVCTGLKLAECADYMYLRIAPRSGLAVKGIDVGAGVVDSDYRGKVKVLLINTTEEPFDVSIHDRIAQMIPEALIPYTECVINGEENSTNESYLRVERGEGGFGSTN